MNTRQLQYALLLSRERSFSLAAEQLKITQPAFSKQILNLEKELGVTLFDRSSNPLSLTPAGETFISHARELVFKEDQLKELMDGYRHNNFKKLTIGISPFRCSYMIGDVVRILQQRYPNLQVVLQETGSEELHKNAVDGSADISIMNLPVDETLLDIFPLEPETIVLAVPDELIPALPPVENDGDYPYPVINLAECENLPFIVLGKHQELRQLFDKLCLLSHLHPTICTEAVGITTALHLALSGVGATILPLPVLLKNKMYSGLSYFSIKHCTFSRKPVIAIRKDIPLSDYAKDAIQLLTKKIEI